MSAPAPYVLLPGTAREALTPYAAIGGRRPLRREGMPKLLLGCAPPAVLRERFHELAEGGEVVDRLIGHEADGAR